LSREKILKIPLFKEKFGMNEDEELLWDYTENMWRVLFADSALVSTWKENNFIEPENILKQWGLQYIKVYPHLRVYPWYLHAITIHTVDCMRRFNLSLNQLSNQGSECEGWFNQYILDNQGTKNGLGQNQKNQVIQFKSRNLIYQCKRLKTQCNEYVLS